MWSTICHCNLNKNSILLPLRIHIKQTKWRTEHEDELFHEFEAQSGKCDQKQTGTEAEERRKE